MNLIDIKEIFWKEKNGNKTLLTELEEEHFKGAYLTIQKRQMEAISSLEMNIKMENAFKKIAKERNIKLNNLNEDESNKFFKNKYIKMKGILERVNRIIKLQLQKDEKVES